MQVIQYFVEVTVTSVVATVVVVVVVPPVVAVSGPPDCLYWQNARALKSVCTSHSMKANQQAVYKIRNTM